MTVTLDGYTAIDLHKTVGFPLNNDGSPDVTGIEDPSDGGIEVAYEGVEFLAPTGLEFSLGSTRLIPVVAQGQVQTTFQLPSIDAKSATLRAAYEKFSVDVMLTDTKVDTIGNAKAMGIDNDKSGQERLIALITSQLQAHDVDDLTLWATTILHRARIKPNRPNMSDSPMEKEYTMSLGRSTKRWWGEVYTQNTHGRREDVGDVILSEYKFGIGLWYGNNILTEFLLPTDKPAITSASAKVWDFETGAARAGAWDEPVQATAFTPTVKPPDNLPMIVTWEYE